MGYDEFSFGYRDLEGSKVHKALREDYGKAYKEGDVIGCFIHMPEGGRRLEKSKHVSFLSNRSASICRPAAGHIEVDLMDMEWIRRHVRR